MKRVGIKVIEEFDADGSVFPEVEREGWQAILNNFKKYAESWE